MRPAKYPYEKLNPGESAEFESDKSLASVRVAALTYGKRHGKKYKVEAAQSAPDSGAQFFRLTRVE